MGGMCSSPAAAAHSSATNTVPSSKQKSKDPAAQDAVRSANGKRFDSVYRLGDKPGEGTFSVVKKGINKTTNRRFAIKIIIRSKLTKEDEEALLDEISILKELNHPCIIRFYEEHKEPQHYHLVTELLQGGELFDRIVSKAYYNEKEARNVCKILFTAMSYFHIKHIAHRDLKPNNLLRMSSTNDSEIKIADFRLNCIIILLSFIDS
jgi:calcium/calmodulin-dependent protein kinase I